MSVIKKINLTTMLLLLGVMVFVTNCKRKENRAAEMSPSVSAYVYGYTSGIISKASPVRIQFASMVLHHHCPGKAGGDIRKLCCILFLAEFFLDSNYQHGAGGPRVKSAEEIEEARWAADRIGTDLAQVAAVTDELLQGVRAKKI